MNEILAQAVEQSSWSPATINILIGGIVIIIGALSAGIVAIIRAINETKKVAVETKELVDGRYGLLLTELAGVRKLLAESTGSPGDMATAVHADNTAKAQQAIVDKVNGKAS